MPPPVQPDIEDDEYHSSSDSDFDAVLSASSAEESESSSDEIQQTKGTSKKPKQKQKQKRDLDGDVEMGSGDEGVIAQGRKKKRKKGKAKAKKGGAQADLDSDEDEDAAGGIRVRLRSGRGGEEQKKKSATTTGTATIDVDSLWARMNAPPVPRPQTKTTSSPGKENRDPSTTSPSKPPQQQPQQQSTTNPPPANEETIQIPHTVRFAGESHTTTKSVPLSSPEAQAYLSAQRAAQAQKSRPLARKNLLDPNPQRLIKGVAPPARTDLPPSIGGTMEKGKRVERKTGGKQEKLNTVEKSKLDWEAEVRREGWREDLDRAEKSGDNAIERMEFLGRVEREREERERAMRLKG